MRFPILTLLLLLLGRPGSSSQDDPRPVRLPSDVTLLEMRSNPGKRLGDEVRFTVQFRRCVETWPAYVSRFGPRDWLAIEVWPDELFTWEVDVWENPVRTLFVRRGSPLEASLRAAHGHGRYEITGRLREVLLGEPWIEVQAIERLEGEVGAGTLVHIGRARELAIEGQFELALDQYQRAKAGPVPPHARAAIDAEMIEIRAAQVEAQNERKSRPR